MINSEGHEQQGLGKIRPSAKLFTRPAAGPLAQGWDSVTVAPKNCSAKLPQAECLTNSTSPKNCLKPIAPGIILQQSHSILLDNYVNVL